MTWRPRYDCWGVTSHIQETELQCLERDRRHNEEERQDALRRRAEFELNVRDLNEKFSRNKTRDVRHGCLYCLNNRLN